MVDPHDSILVSFVSCNWESFSLKSIHYGFKWLGNKSSSTTAPEYSNAIGREWLTPAVTYGPVRLNLKEAVQLCMIGRDGLHAV